ncbi:MAG: Xaa-Pro peptidase family protein [Myxococcota bacterium]|nr:Xaa-Pro peptidase family protein [Myxococcota bacterium]
MASEKIPEGGMELEGRARVIWDSSVRCADLRYVAALWAADPVVWIDLDGRTHLLVRDLEVERAGREARVDEVVPLAGLDEAAEAADAPKAVRGPVAFLLRAGARRVELHPDTPAWIVEALRKTPLDVAVGAAPFFPERSVKTEEEVRAIATSEAAAERAVGLVEQMLWDARRDRGALTLAGEPLTSERVRREVETVLFAEGFLLERTIVSSGRASAVPHDVGSGPLSADVPIVVDVFPRSLSTGYYGDITRTFVKGTPSQGVLRMYGAIRAAQEAALAALRPGVLLRDVHSAAQDLLASHGFENRVEPGRAEGFIHGTGHGVGLEIHEPPQIGRIEGDARLEAGNVVTVEPGLYYHDEGGVRLEDLVVVTSEGHRRISTLPRDLVVIP